MRQRQSLERAVSDFKRLQRDYEDALTLIELGEAENDEASITEGEAALKRVDLEAHHRSVEAMLSGEADAMSTYVEVHAGAGGTESGSVEIRKGGATGTGASQLCVAAIRAVCRLD